MIDRSRIALPRRIRDVMLACLLLVAFTCMLPAHGAVPPTAPGVSAIERADVATRFAIHDGFDRLVMSLPPGIQATSRQAGDTVLLQLPGCGHVIPPPHWGGRMLGLQGVPGQATLQLAPGARVRVWRLGDRLVVDVLNAAVVSAPHPLASSGVLPGGSPPRATEDLSPASLVRGGPRVPATLPASLARPPGHVVAAPVQPLTLGSRVVPPRVAARILAGDDGEVAVRHIEAAKFTSNIPAPIATPGQAVAPDPATPLPSGSAVLPLARDGDIDGPAVLVPCPRGTGAAAFQRAGEAHIVFDGGKALDLSALKDDPVFGDISEQVLTDGLELRLHLPAGGQLRLLHRAEGWALIVTSSAHFPALPDFEGHVQGEILALHAKSPGRIIVLADDVTGGRLLAGTQTGDGQRMPAAHAASEYSILPSWLGLVVASKSDRLVMRTLPSGFELSSQTPPGLALAWSKAGPVSWPDGRVMTRLFELPDLPPESLHRRLGQALRDAALAPRPARLGPRLAVARSMLAQGMDVEAASVLHTALTDDPAHLGDPDVQGLSAIANWLSAKTGGAEAPRLNFDPARLGGSDEAVLWRALLQCDTRDPASQAAALAPVWPLIFSYPAPLRRPMLLAASDLLQAGGQTAAWAALLTESSDPALDLSRAALLRQQGRDEAALALLDGVAARPDRLARAEALQQALELRLAKKRLSTSAAADALDRQLFEWRGNGRELKLRMRVAALRAQAGAWRAALSGLRDAEQSFPEARTVLHQAEEMTVADFLLEERAAKLASFDLVSLAEEAANLFSSAEVERRLGPILVEKLLALDLPDRAEPILSKLFDRTSDRASKAEYGLGLASLIADRGEQPAALEVLSLSDDDGLGSSLIKRRTLLRARLLGALGKAGEALTLLEGQHGPEASDIQASLFEKSNDWAGASAVLQAAMKQQDFAQSPEQTQRALILRLARDESTAGDVAGLRVLRETQHLRFALGDGAELFAILTADPVTSAVDLPRSGREIASLRTLPTKLAQPRAF